MFAVFKLQRIKELNLRAANQSSSRTRNKTQKLRDALSMDLINEKFFPPLQLEEKILVPTFHSDYAW